MDSYNISNNKNKEVKYNKANICLNNIKSNYILKRIFNNILQGTSLFIIKYNKKMQNRLNININDYKEYTEKSPIEIDIIPKKVNYNYDKFIKLPCISEKLYYHIYFNDNKEEAERNYLLSQDNVNRIKIIIDYQVKSLEKLFKDCQIIESINFIKFARVNISSMHSMFER